MGTDFWLVVQWWSILFVFGAAAYPLTRRLFGGTSRVEGDQAFLSKTFKKNQKKNLRNAFLQDQSSKISNDMGWLAGRSFSMSWLAGRSFSMSWLAGRSFNMSWLAGRSFSVGWWDKGYFFSKAVGLAVVTWLVYAIGTIKLMQFSVPLILLCLVMLFGFGVWIVRVAIHNRTKFTDRGVQIFGQEWARVVIQELAFFLLLLFWSWIKAHEPSIRGLEKFMDYGFTQSILTYKSFPVWDFWYAGNSINYYYFGHITMAVLTEFSGIPLAYTFNLMLATIFALCATMSFSIGYQFSTTGFIFRSIDVSSHKRDTQGFRFGQTVFYVASGLLTSLLVTLAGNMQTIYAFTQGYTGENVKPFWELMWDMNDFWVKLPDGIQKYWYANATRFIPFTIHEFPSYSFVVSDMHGHVLSIPYALLAIAGILMIFGLVKHADAIVEENEGEVSVLSRLLRLWQGIDILWILFYGFLVGVLLMTNALDGPIYTGLLVISAGVYFGKMYGFSSRWFLSVFTISALVVGGVVLASLPFTLFFKSFVSGVAINCPPSFLANQKYGPIIFEGVEKCQKSPLWMWWLLWGFFVYNGIVLVYRKMRVSVDTTSESFKLVISKTNATHLDLALLTLFFYGLFLVIVPEFIYFKDIYPAHFRSNTMFKLGYQAYMMFSIVSGYVIMQVFVKKVWNAKKVIFILFLIPQICLVGFYPFRSVPSYFGDLKTYHGLYGLSWIDTEYPENVAVITWLQAHAVCDFGTKDCKTPVIAEADGDSYTDYNQVSAFSGMPSVVGWAVHEWLWRGSYDVVAPRREDVRKIYESTDTAERKAILDKYSVQYIVVGKIEHDKYKALAEDKIKLVAAEVFRSGQTVLYKAK